MNHVHHSSFDNYTSQQLGEPGAHYAMNYILRVPPAATMAKEECRIMANTCGHSSTRSHLLMNYGNLMKACLSPLLAQARAAARTLKIKERVRHSVGVL